MNHFSVTCNFCGSSEVEVLKETHHKIKTATLTGYYESIEVTKEYHCRDCNTMEEEKYELSCIDA